ncbi:WD40-repeat-containing domain protein, partial [Chytridium lagenaria]
MKVALSRVIKENHGSAVVNIYDNDHCDGHLDVVSQFCKESDCPLHQSKACGKMVCCTWVKSFTDATIAIGTDCGIVRLISLSRSEEVICMACHDGTISDMKAHPRVDNHVATIGSDGFVRLWDLRSEECIGSHRVDGALCLSFRPTNDSWIVGCSDGTIASISNGSVSLSLVRHKTSVTTVRCSGRYVISKSLDGHVCVWMITNSYMFLDCKRSIFDVSPDCSHFCVGTDSGKIYICSVTENKTVTVTEKKMTRPVLSCTFSYCGR